MTRVLIIDNFDSFVYNIAQYLGEMDAEIIVKRNNVSLKEAKDARPDRIVLSPGPGHPRNSNVSLEILATLSKDIPTLGICLGHQAIAQIFGGKIAFADRILHGKTSLIHHNSKGIFSEIKNPFAATRYHSLSVNRHNLPDSLEITAETKQKEIMAIKHKQYPVNGLQFHPESILTEEGKKILGNFLEGKT